MNKLTRKTTALIKDLELQLDYLCGYSPSGAHWKMEYHIREGMISDTLASEDTPEPIREKINRILEKLYELRNGKRTEQPYLNFTEHHTIIVNTMGQPDEPFDLPGAPLPAIQYRYE